MSKIEEITEILVNELSVFKEDVEKLEELNEKIQSTKINVDVQEIKSILQEHESKMKYTLDSQERIRFEQLLKNARIYPNWAVLVFIISLLISFGAMFFVFVK